MGCRSLIQPAQPPPTARLVNPMHRTIPLILILLWTSPALALPPLRASVSFQDYITSTEQLLVRFELMPSQDGSTDARTYRESIYVVNGEQITLLGHLTWSDVGVAVSAPFRVLDAISDGPLVAIVYQVNRQIVLQTYARHDDGWVVPIAARHVVYEVTNDIFRDAKLLNGRNGRVSLTLSHPREEESDWLRYSVVLSRMPANGLLRVAVEPE